MAGILLGILLLLAALVFAVRIKEIKVTGNSHYTEEQVIDLVLGGKWSRNSAFCYYENRFREHKSIPFIEEYKIEFKSPTKIEIVVFEKSVVGYVSYMSSYMYFDKDGIIVESSVEQLPGVPWITGLDFGHIILPQPLPVADPDTFGEILNLTQQLSVYHIQVDRIRFGSSGQPSLTIGQMEVTLGDGGDVDGKLSLLNDILRDHPELKDKKGTLELDGYSDTGNDGTIPFKLK